jgi:hypothetical protein
MENNGEPLWATELRKFTEFSLGKLGERLTSKIDGLDQRLTLKIDGLDQRLTRKVENIDVRITNQLEALATDVAQVKDDVCEIKNRLTAIEHPLN